MQAQSAFSVASDMSLQRNLDNTHPFLAIGQAIMGQLHLTGKSTLYGLFGIYTKGKYKTVLTAKARLPLTQPNSFVFTSRGMMRLRQLSVGYKRFISGQYDKPNHLNIYYTAGFGLIIGTVTNQFSPSVDTATYTTEKNLREGTGDFRRLTADLCIGGEYNLANDIFFYTDFRLAIPTTNYPYDLLSENKGSPLPACLHFGIRILFKN